MLSTPMVSWHMSDKMAWKPRPAQEQSSAVSDIPSQTGTRLRCGAPLALQVLLQVRGRGRAGVCLKDADVSTARGRDIAALQAKHEPEPSVTHDPRPRRLRRESLCDFGSDTRLQIESHTWMSTPITKPPGRTCTSADATCNHAPGLHPRSRTRAPAVWGLLISWATSSRLWMSLHVSSLPGCMILCSRWISWSLNADLARNPWACARKWGVGISKRRERADVRSSIKPAGCPAVPWLAWRRCRPVLGATCADGRLARAPRGGVGCGRPRRNARLEGPGVTVARLAPAEGSSVCLCVSVRVSHSLSLDVD